MRSRIIQEHGGDSSKGGSTHTEVRAVRRDNLSSPTKRSLSYKLVTSLTITMKIAITTLPINSILTLTITKVSGEEWMDFLQGPGTKKTKLELEPYPTPQATPDPDPNTDFSRPVR